MARHVLAMAVLLLGVGFAQAGWAGDDAVGDLQIEQPWSRATPPGTSVGVGYLSIVNRGDEADRLLGAESPTAGRVQIHRTVKSDGMSTMEHQDKGVAIPAGGRVVLEPGGYHLMLMHLEAPLEEGDRVPVTLHFRRTGTVDVELAVRSLTATD